MTHEPNTEHVLALAAIIREVNGSQRLGAAALAEAILAHPASQWGPALPAPTDAELQADFRAWFKDRYSYFGGINLRDVIAWGKHLLQQSPQPAAPWPELPDSPPLGESGSGFRFGPCDTAWFAGRLQGWRLARAELERQREQAGAAPTLAPAPFPYISDDLVPVLICNIMEELTSDAENALKGQSFSSVGEIRARLMHILGVAAKQAAERPAS